MKQFANKLLAISMLLSIAPATAGTVSGKSFFLPVANGGTAVNTLGVEGCAHKFDMDEMYGTFRVSAEFGQNFKRDEIGKYLLMNGTNSAVFGPRKTTANDTDAHALNFLLDQDTTTTPAGTGTFKSTVTFKPKAQDFVMNMGLFLGLDSFLEGLFFTAHVPVQHSKWEVVMNETVATAGNAAFVAGNVDATATPNVPYSTVTAAMVGDKTVGDVTTARLYANINGSQSDTKVGDVKVALGYDFVNREHAHFGIGVQALLGAGGKSKAAYVFEPVFGHAGRHGVGGVVDGAVRLWDRDADHQLTAHLHASAVHLFANDQVRTYDISGNGAWSRYQLLKQISALTAVPGNTYDGIMVSAANITTLTAKIGIDVAYDANLMFHYTMGNLSLDLGYQVAGHGKEKHKEWVDTITADKYIVYGGAAAADALAANDNNGYINLPISGFVTGATPAVVGTTNNSTYTVINNNLDKDSALAGSALEHCVYGGLNYTWMDSDWMPGVGVFGSAHFSGDDNNSFDRWSVGVQGNVSF